MHGVSLPREYVVGHAGQVPAIRTRGGCAMINPVVDKVLGYVVFFGVLSLIGRLAYALMVKVVL